MFVRLVLPLAGAIFVLSASLVFASGAAGSLLPRSEQIAFVAWYESSTTSLVQLIDVQRRLTVTLFKAFGRIDHLNWSSDGRLLYFAPFRSERTSRDLAALDVENRRFTWLTDTPDDKNTPSPSPDGRYLAYQGISPNEAGGWNLYRFDLTTGDIRALYRGDSFDGRPAWSPDGRIIVFESVFRGEAASLFIMNLAHRAPYDLAGTASWMAAWSPDSRQIAFATRRETNLNIYLIRPDRTGLRRITGSLATDLSPSWSPDGRRLAFTSNRAASGYYHIYIIAVDTQPTRDSDSARALTSGLMDHLSPVWRP